MHCPPKNLNLRIKTEPATVTADATVCIRFLICKQKPDIYRCIRTDRLRTTYINAEIEIIFGTVYTWKLYYTVCIYTGNVHNL